MTLEGDVLRPIRWSTCRAGGNPITALYRWAHRRFPGFIDCRFIDARAHLVEAGFTIARTVHVSIWGLPVDIVMATNP